MHDNRIRPETVVRRSREDASILITIVSDPADAHHTRYAVLTRADGTLVGSYYPADAARQEGWYVVTADGTQHPVASEAAAVILLTTTAPGAPHDL
ncbi:hypothetical protein [Allokutzneria oryzae]|uniref:Immunity protein 35 domain-containing protein n=1 Tax=Allokutzneria oryzae TaxID=1378989 RepID=A0ABV5ZR39_9PSEU